MPNHRLFPAFIGANASLLVFASGCNDLVAEGGGRIHALGIHHGAKRL